MAELHQPDGAVTARIEVGSERMQNPVGILMSFVDQRGKIALGIEHDMPLFQSVARQPVWNGS